MTGKLSKKTNCFDPSRRPKHPPARLDYSSSRAIPLNSSSTSHIQTPAILKLRGSAAPEPKNLKIEAISGHLRPKSSHFRPACKITYFGNFGLWSLGLQTDRIDTGPVSIDR